MERSRALDAVFKPVHPATTFEETVERLGTAVRLGLLAPRTRLPPERELAERLGISRSTLRLALTTLVRSGHLVSLRGRAGGTFVAEAPPLALREERKLLGEHARAVLDERLAVELGATQLAAERAEESDFGRLDRLVDRMVPEGDFDAYRRADVGFHIAIAEAARSSRLVTAMTEVQGQLSDLIARIAHREESLIRATAQHRRLVTVLRRRDAGRALRLIREHAGRTEQRVAGLS